MLGVFALVSLWVLGLDLWQVVVHGRVWTGTDGLFIADQMQYLAWIRDASSHGLASDLFVLGPTAHDYLQPAVEVSAGLTALGMAPWLSLIIWKPVAVLGAFFAIRAYTRRLLPDRFAARAALVLALFFGSFGALGDEWMPFWSWGYPFGLMGIAAMVGALLLYARARSEGRLSPWPPLLGLLAAWLHPWQGETLILVVIAGEAISWLSRADKGVIHGRSATRWGLLVGTCAATLLPLLYYAILDQADPVWRLGRIANDNGWGLNGIVISLVPLLVAAALAYRRRPQSYLAAATMAWPLVTLCVYGLAEAGLGATPLHSFAGITIPLAVLAVQGVGSIRWRIPRPRLVATVIVALATIPASIDIMGQAYHYMGPAHNDGNFIKPAEQRALSFLAHAPAPGGVLTWFYLGGVVPAETGRHTYIGDTLWSVPNYKGRFALTFKLFKWPLADAQARAIVLRLGARFVLADCHNHAGGLLRKLTPISSSIHHFGCATVYQIR